MQIVDANVLLYASDERSPDHRPAREWLDGTLAGHNAVAVSWHVLLTFLRLSTHPAVFPQPLTADEASAQIERWVAEPRALVLQPTQRHIRLVRGLLTQVGTAGNLVNDAHLAALALEHGGEVVSFDRDFARLEGVPWRLPA